MDKQPDARLERVLATLALTVVGVISLANVVVRYFTDASFAFTEEVSVFLLVVLTFAGASVALRRNRHIRIGLLERLCPRLRVPLILLQWLAGVLVLGWCSGTAASSPWRNTSGNRNRPASACRTGGTWSGCRCWRC